MSENEVVLKDPREMQVDPLHGLGQDTGGTVLKIIKKTEVEILCTQHNPVRQRLCVILGSFADCYRLIGRCSSEEGVQVG